MALYSFPTNDFQRWRQLLGTLGSYWNSVYESPEHLRSIVEARIQAHEQTMLDLMELFNSMAREQVPILHRDNWYVLYLQESDKNQDPLRYNAAGEFGDGKSFGQTAGQEGYTFPVPDDLSEASIVVNRFTDPSLLWYRDVDFELDTENHTIRFQEDPFEKSTVPIREIREGGEITDREAVLWLFRPQFDWEHLYKQFGYILGQKLSSRRESKELLNAILDAITGGTSHRDVIRGLSAVTGIPVTTEPTETVEFAQYDLEHLLVITDQHVYRFNPSNTSLVAPGDVVHAGDPLTDAFQIFEFNRGVAPDELRALAMGEGFLSSCFYGDLIFENKSVPLVVEEDVDGFTKLSFGLGGFPHDVTEFFDQVHARGIEAAVPVSDPDCQDPTDMVEYPQNYDEDAAACGETPTSPDSVWLMKGTLAHYLDRRERVVGEPTAATLPATINPLEFLIANILRNNAFAVKVRMAGLGEQALGLGQMGHLQKIVPPRTAMLLIVELTPRTDVVTMDLLEDSGPEVFDGVEPFTDSVSTSLLDSDQLTLRLVSGTCH